MRRPKTRFKESQIKIKQNSSQEVGDIGRQLLDDDVVEPLYICQHSLVLVGDEVDRHALPPEAPAPADTVEVVLRLGRQVVVDDEGDLLNIDAAGEEVGGDENAGRARPELAHDDVSRVLIHVAVGGRDRVIPAPQLVGEPINFAPRVDENDALSDGQRFVEVAEGLELPIFLIDVHIELFYAFQGQFISLDEDPYRFVHKFAGDFQSFRRHCGRENAHLNF